MSYTRFVPVRYTSTVLFITCVHESDEHMCLWITLKTGAYKMLPSWCMFWTHHTTWWVQNMHHGGSSCVCHQPCHNHLVLYVHHFSGCSNCYLRHMWPECSKSAQEQRTAPYKNSINQSIFKSVHIEITVLRQLNSMTASLYTWSLCLMSRTITDRQG